MPYLTTDFSWVVADNSFRGGDPRRVEIDTPEERAFWCKVLHVSEEELRAAVTEAGTRAQDVKDYLARNKRND
jgi:hypothetical protein